MSISPMGLVRAGWASAKQNIGTFLLFCCFVAAIAFGLAVFQMVVLMGVGKGVGAMTFGVALYFFASIAVGGYLRVAMTRLAQLGSGGARVAFRELVQWDGSLVLRMIGLEFLVIAFGLAGYAAIAILAFVFSFVFSFSVFLGTVFAGILALVLVGYLLHLAMVQMLAPFFVLERVSVWQSLRRALQMVRGSFWRILGFSVLVMLMFVATILPSILAFAASSYMLATGGVDALATTVALGMITSLVVGIYSTVTFVLALAVTVFAQGHLFRQLSSSSQ